MSVLSFLELDIFQTKVLEKFKTCIIYSITFFFENSAFYEIKRKKYCRAGHAIHENMAHKHCTLDTKGYRHTLRIRNNYYFSPA
jgi:hypothetical protein